ncbi:MAG TPA: carboxypeptidase-like regulatory domain-containing protein, partial [Terriglobia bacterium]|nr:carboxypeptidase-like regulatory domain-containing protein [Terriglobia bacterium]
MNRFRFRAVVVASLLIAVVFSANLALAQATSSVRGTIADQQGGVIPNAAVTLFNKETNFTRTQLSTATGNFSFDLVPPGRYTLGVEAAGFKKTEMPIEALIARPTDIGILKLYVGTTGDTVTVTAENQAV